MDSAVFHNLVPDTRNKAHAEHSVDVKFYSLGTVEYVEVSESQNKS